MRSLKLCHSSQIMSFMSSHVDWSNHVIHVKSCHSCQIMSFMSNHVIHVKSCHSCQIMSFMSNHVIHVKSCHSCQIMSFMSNHVESFMSNHAIHDFVMKILVGLHQINAIVRSRGEHAARTINACAAAGLRDRHEC
jgi:hypothetical protein